MTYRISPLARSRFEHLFEMDDVELARHAAVRVVADSDRGYPCRACLDDARKGERLILLNYVSNDNPGPFRTAYAIYVSETGEEARPLIDELPPYLQNRVLSLRAFDARDMAITARLVEEGGADAAIREIFAEARVAYIMAHFAAFGCFAARVDRHVPGSGDKR